MNFTPKMGCKPIQILFAELTSNSGWRDGKPHWRAQNQIAHAALGCFIAASLEEIFHDQLTVLFLTAIIGTLWEAVTLLKNGPKKTTCYKSTIDIIFYTMGASVVVSTSFLGTLALIGATLLGAGIWAVSGSQRV